ncbi:MAG: hypothetical protein R3F56_16375 [Planctomycetota bacterium]
MPRVPDTLLLASILSLALGAWFLATPSSALPEPTAAGRDPARESEGPDAEVVVASNMSGAELAPAPLAAESRRALDGADAMRDDAGPRRHHVRVRGQVRRSGHPLGRCELSFLVAGQEWRDEDIDWDRTDRQGRYDVELPAGTYVVWCDAGYRTSRTLVVPAWSDDLVFDVELPPD